MRKQVEELVVKALEEAVNAGELPLETIPDPGLERPRDKSNGDWATTVAMRCAKQARMNPRAIADIVAQHLQGSELLSQAGGMLSLFNAFFSGRRLTPKEAEELKELIDRHTWEE